MKLGKLLGLGVLTWLVPFIISIPFFSKTGEPVIDIFTIKSIMIVVSSAFGGYLILLYFKKVESEFLKNALIVGFVWLAINWLLDFILLVPMMKLTVTVYFGQIGSRYLIIPIMSLMVGWNLKQHQ